MNRNGLFNMYLDEQGELATDTVYGFRYSRAPCPHCSLWPLSNGSTWCPVDDGPTRDEKVLAAYQDAVRYGDFEACDCREYEALLAWERASRAEPGEQKPAPLWLTRSGLMRRWAKSDNTVDRRRAERGFPEEY